MTLFGNLFGSLFGDSAAECEARGDQFAAVNNWYRARDEYEQALHKTTRDAPSRRRLHDKLTEAENRAFDAILEDIHSRIDVREFTYAAEQIERARTLARTADQQARLQDAEDRLGGMPRTPRPAATVRRDTVAVDPGPGSPGPETLSATATSPEAAELQALLPKLPPAQLAARLEWGARYVEAARALHAGEADRAVALLQALLEEHPNEVGLLYELGNAMQAQGRMADAAALYRARMQAAPSDWQAWYELARATWASGATDEALAVLAQAMEIHPRSGHLAAQWGLFLHELGRTEQALQKLYHALQLDEFDDPGLYHTLATLHRERGEHDKARRGFLKALELDPQRLGTRLDYAEFLLEEGQDPTAAREVLEPVFRWLATHPAAPALYGVYASYLASRVHMQLDEREMALLAVSRAIEDNPAPWLAERLEAQRQAVLAV